jgi:hypothetical protein
LMSLLFSAHFWWPFCFLLIFDDPSVFCSLLVTLLFSAHFWWPFCFLLIFDDPSVFCSFLMTLLFSAHFWWPFCFLLMFDDPSVFSNVYIQHNPSLIWLGIKQTLTSLICILQNNHSIYVIMFIILIYLFVYLQL